MHTTWIRNGRRCCSVTKSLCNSLWPHGLEHTRLPCPSRSPGVCSNSCLLSRWCHPTISSSVTPFSSCPQSFSLSGSFPMNWLFKAKKTQKVSADLLARGLITVLFWEAGSQPRTQHLNLGAYNPAETQDKDSRQQEAISMLHHYHQCYVNITGVPCWHMHICL